MANKDEKPKPKKTVVNVFDGPVRVTGSTGTAADGRTFQIGIDNRRKNNED